jgi:hypothetical protein
MAAKRRGEHTSFEDVVTGLRRARPIPALPDTVPFGQLPPTDPQRVAYPIAVRALRAAEARELVADGAALAWDCCGCGAAQCLRWFGSSDRDRLAAGGRPVAEKGDLWLWSNADGDLAVIAESDTEWGDLLG